MSARKPSPPAQAELTGEDVPELIKRAPLHHEGPGALQRTHAALVELNNVVHAYDPGAVESAREFAESFERDVDALEVAVFEIWLRVANGQRDLRRLVRAIERSNRRKSNDRWKARREFCIAQMRAWLANRGAHESKARTQKALTEWLEDKCAVQFPKDEVPERKTFQAYWREAKHPQK